MLSFIFKFMWPTDSNLKYFWWEYMRYKLFWDYVKRSVQMKMKTVNNLSKYLSFFAVKIKLKCFFKVSTWNFWQRSITRKKKSLFIKKKSWKRHCKANVIIACFAVLRTKIWKHSTHCHFHNIRFERKDSCTKFFPNLL